MKRLKVHIFEDEFEKWFEAKKKRFNIMKLKWYFTIYDHIKFDIVKDKDGEHLMFEEEKDAREMKDFLNSLWEIKLKKMCNERLESANIWEPMFIIKGNDL